VKVYLQLYSVLRDKLPPEAKGRAIYQLKDESTLRDLLDDLKITRKVVISVNGTQITDKTYPLRDGDEVKIFSSISGG
jgi:sulfur carrier protein ThiS